MGTVGGLYEATYGLSTSSGATASALGSYLGVRKYGAFEVGSGCSTKAVGYIRDKKLGIEFNMSCYSNGEH